MFVIANRDKVQANRPSCMQPKIANLAFSPVYPRHCTQMCSRKRETQEELSRPIESEARLTSRTCGNAKLALTTRCRSVSKADQGSALKRAAERQCVDSDDERERRMYSVSALNSATIRRSLSFSSLSSAMESAMFSTLLRSRCRTCDWQSEGGRLNFIALPTRLPFAFPRLH
jgi:hypothetical protein